jgi:hypothetical protein
MFKFLKRIRRDGFVCGFGWGPHSHDQAKKDISIPNNQPPSESPANLRKKKKYTTLGLILL